jgi:hypothetical protein
LEGSTLSTSVSQVKKTAVPHHTIFGDVKITGLHKANGCWMLKFETTFLIREDQFRAAERLLSTYRQLEHIDLDVSDLGFTVTSRYGLDQEVTALAGNQFRYTWSRWLDNNPKQPAQTQATRPGTRSRSQRPDNRDSVKRQGMVTPIGPARRRQQ